MKISRREFLGTATTSAVAFALPPAMGRGRLGAETERHHDCVLFDSKSGCVLRESLQGYQAALAGKHSSWLEAKGELWPRCQMAIVPGVALLDTAVPQGLVDLLQAGTHVLLESGAAFLNAAEFGAHQKILERYFDVSVERPVDLWTGMSADGGLLTHGPSRTALRRRRELDHKPIPYIAYSWPFETTVRDFSRVIPVSAKREEVIGRVRTLPIALKKRVANATLIFLGAPLGPALLAGDPEARAWLRSVTSLLSCRAHASSVVPN